MAERKLTITSCNLVHEGTNAKGRSYRIYEIKAATPEGQPLPADMKLRSFTELPVGETVEVEVERYESDKHGVSFTLKRKGGGSGYVKELAARVEALESAVQTLGERMAKLEDSTSKPPPVATASALTGNDDSIPF